MAGPSCHADSPLCYGVRSRLPLSVSRRQLPVSSFFQLSSRVPLPLPVPPRFQVQNPLSIFAPKQTKESSAWRATYIVLQIYIQYIYMYISAWISRWQYNKWIRHKLYNEYRYFCLQMQEKYFLIAIKLDLFFVFSFEAELDFFFRFKARTICKWTRVFDSGQESWVGVRVSHTEELWCNETVCGWQICSPTPRGVKLSNEGSNGCNSRKARLFEWIELSVAVKRIYVKQNKCDS